MTLPLALVTKWLGGLYYQNAKAQDFLAGTSELAVVALLFTGVAVDVVAVALPETGRVLGEEPALPLEGLCV